VLHRPYETCQKVPKPAHGMRAAPSRRTWSSRARNERPSRQRRRRFVHQTVKLHYHSQPFERVFQE
jgi:hypothetical protein